MVRILAVFFPLFRSLSLGFARRSTPTTPRRRACPPPHLRPEMTPLSRSPSPQLAPRPNPSRNRGRNRDFGQRRRAPPPPSLAAGDCAAALGPPSPLSRPIEILGPGLDLT